MVGEQTPGLPHLYFHLRCISSVLWLEIKPRDCHVCISTSSGVLPPCCGRRACPGTATSVFPPPPVYYLRVVVGEQALGLPRLCISTSSGVLPPCCGRRTSPGTATSLYFHLLRCITSGVLPPCFCLLNKPRYCHVLILSLDVSKGMLLVKYFCSINTSFLYQSNVMEIIILVKMRQIWPPRFLAYYQILISGIYLLFPDTHIVGKMFG